MPEKINALIDSIEWKESRELNFIYFHVPVVER